MKKNILLNLAVFCLLLLTFPLFASASAFANKIRIILVDIIGIAEIILIGGAILAFVVAGIYFIMGGNDPSKLSTAKTLVIWGVIGLFIGLLARAIVGWVESRV